MAAAEGRSKERQAVLVLLLPHLQDADTTNIRTICSIARVSVASRQDVRAFLKSNLPAFVASAIQQLQSNWHSDLRNKTLLGYLCRTARGSSEMRSHDTGANALQQLQDGVGTPGDLTGDKADAVMRLLARGGLQLNDSLLAACAKHHNLFGRLLPPILFKHSCLKDHAGGRLTGLGLDMEAVALAQQEVLVWRQTEQDPARLSNLLTVARYMHGEDDEHAGIFDALLELDRTGTQMLFAPHESSRFISAGGSGQQDEAQELSCSRADLLAQLIEISAYHGSTKRMRALLALPPTDALGADTLAEMMLRLAYGMSMQYIVCGKAAVEEAFTTMCQLPNAQDISASQIADVLACNAKACSTTIDQEMLRLPNALNMSPDHILKLLHKSVLGGRVFVMRFLSKLMGGVVFDANQVYYMMRDIAELGDPTSFPMMMSDLRPFDVGRYLGVEHIVWCLNACASKPGGSRCMPEAFKYFTSLAPAKTMHPDDVAEIALNAVSNPTHCCQHNALSEALRALLHLPTSDQVTQPLRENCLLGALHNGCMPCVKALLKRWGKTLNKPYKDLGADHLVKALKGCFQHSRCAPEELFKGVVNHPSAALITSEDLEPVLELVCGSAPLGRQDCDNDACGPPTATAPQVLRRAPGNPLKRLLQLPAAQGVSAELLVKLITLSYEELQDQELWAGFLSAGGADAPAATAAANQLPQATVVSMVSKLVATPAAAAATPAAATAPPAAALAPGYKALKTLLKTDAMRQLGPAELSQLLQQGVAGNCSDEQLARLVRLPGAQQLKLPELAALLAAAAGADMISVSVQLLRLPNAPKDGVYAELLAEMAQPAAAAAAAGANEAAGDAANNDAAAAGPQAGSGGGSAARGRGQPPPGRGRGRGQPSPGRGRGRGYGGRGGRAMGRGAGVGHGAAAAANQRYHPRGGFGRHHHQR